MGRVTRRHRSQEFLAFLNQVDRATDSESDLHVNLDNSSTHRTPAVNRWLKSHPRVHFHFTSTSASWLNAVESWFGQLERRSPYRVVFTSVLELRDELHRHIKVHNEEPAKPFKWTKTARSIIEEQSTFTASLTNGINQTGHQRRSRRVYEADLLLWKCEAPMRLVPVQRP